MKVTLLGDSIRLIGYGTLFPEILGEGFEVFQPQDNCRWAKYTLWGLSDWREAMSGTDIVHWNNGIWDCADLYGDGPFTPVDQYVRDMCRVADVLLKRYPRVIFATSTPSNGDDRETANARIREYNAAVVPALKAKGILINDLYSLVDADLDGNICEDKLHLSEKGIRLCAEQTARIIKETAKTL